MTKAELMNKLFGGLMPPDAPKFKDHYELEDAIEMLKCDEESSEDIELKSLITALITLLISKNVFEFEEYIDLLPEVRDSLYKQNGELLLKELNKENW